MDPDSSSQLVQQSHLLVVCCVLLISLFFSGLISAYESALTGLSHLRLQKRADEGDRPSAQLLKLLKTPHQTLLTLMISDWLADVTILVLAAYLMFHYATSWWMIAALICLLTPIILVLGEIIPKAIATHFGEKLVYAWLPLMRLLLTVFSVPARMIAVLTRPFLDLLGARLGQLVPDFTEEEILQMVNLGGNTGMLDKGETELVQHALSFDDTPAASVLTPRVDMISIEDNCTIEEALCIMAGDEGYSRLPVYRDNLDNIIGIAYIKDLLRMQQTGAPPDETVADHMRPAHHIHEYQSIDVVLKEMQARRMPMFIVTDEYGGTVGLITMEDLLEEIVGEIHDEFDQDEKPPMQSIDAHTLLVDARVSVSEVNEALDIDLPNGQSVAGLVFSTLGEAPKPGQELRIGDALLRVEQIDGIRILQLRIHKLSPGERPAEVAESSSAG